MHRSLWNSNEAEAGILWQAVSFEATGCRPGAGIALHLPGWRGMRTVITAHMGTVARLAGRFPGPVFDLRPPEGDRMPKIVIGRHVLPLEQTSASSLRSILAAAERLGYPIYVVGEEEQWEEMLSQATGLTEASPE